MTISNRFHFATLGTTALAVGALALAGCGGSSSSTSTAAAAGHARPAPAPGPAGSGQVTATDRTRVDASAGSQSRHQEQGATKAVDRVTTPHGGKLLIQAGRQNPGSREGPTTEGNLGAPKAANPCALVTRSEARAIVGAPIVGQSEAPLGPTCIFRVHGQRPIITLTVERSTLAATARRLKSPQHTAIRGHIAVCGMLGQPMLFVPIGGGRILNVTAPCTMATALAATALTRL
jgi:hypothetical protein